MQVRDTLFSPFNQQREDEFVSPIQVNSGLFWGTRLILLLLDNLKRTHGPEYLALNCQASEWFSIIYQSPSCKTYISMLISALLMGTKQYPPLLPFNQIKYNVTLLVLIYAFNHIASEMSKRSIDVSRSLR